MSNVKTSPNATRVAPLPSIPVVRTDNPALNQCLEAMRAHLEIRQGERGNPWERAATLRDLQYLGADPATLESLARLPGGKRPPAMGFGSNDGAGPGGSAFVGMDVGAMAQAILDTNLFKNLSRRLDDASRFDYLPQVMQAALTRSIAQEAAARGADIRRIEDVVHNGAMSFAQRIEEVTASLQGVSAGVRQVAAAYADADRAVASQVTQVEARLDDFDGGGAAVEQVMSAVADRATGLEAQYTVKVQAGGAVAGFGLAATSPVGGTPSSAFIVQADKFAIVSPTYSGGLNPNPAAALVPFGVDTTTNPHTIFLNGQVRINAQVRGIKLTASSYDYNTTTGNPASITFTATLQGGLTGSVVFKDGTGAVIAGSGNVRTLATAGMGAGFIVEASVSDGVYTWKDSVGVANVANGAPGSPGIAGQRGATRTVRTIAGSTWSNSEASAAISALGFTVVLRDEVTLRNHSTNPTYLETRYWDGSSWAVPGVVIDGNLLVKGSVTTDAINTNTLSSVNIDTSGRIKAQGGESAYDVGPGKILKAPIYGVNDLANDYSVTRFGVVGFGSACSGVIGYSNSSIVAADGIVGAPRNAGVVGIGGYGGYFRSMASGLAAVLAEANPTTGVAAELRGAIRWGIFPNNFTIPAPPNNTTQFLRADGTWAAPSSGGVSSFNGRTGTVTLTGGDVSTAVAGSTLAVNITGNAATVAGYGAGDLIVRGGSGFTLTVPGVGTWPGCTIT